MSHKTSALSKRNINRLSLAFALVICSFVAVVAADDPFECFDATILYARGSTQDAKVSDEYVKLEKLVDEFVNKTKINKDALKSYELGSDRDYINRYDLKEEGLYSPQDSNILNLLGAKVLPSGLALPPALETTTNLATPPAFALYQAFSQYHNNVERGVDELTKVLEIEHEKCPDTRLVLVGYSQGAQVIGDTLSQQKLETIRKQIVYVALFGDPKLSMPEGRPISSDAAIVANVINVVDKVSGFACIRNPILCAFKKDNESSVLQKARRLFYPACRGKLFSPWRRGTVGCMSDSGMLGARNPYMPPDIENRVGSWCDAKDGICDGNPLHLPFTSSNSHFNYSDSYIEAAWLREILPAIGGLKSARPTIVEDAAPATIFAPRPTSADEIEDFIKVAKTYNQGSDVAFLIDTSSSMADDIEAAKATAMTTGQVILANGGRVAVASFADGELPYLYNLKTPFSTDINQFQRAINSLKTCDQEDPPPPSSDCGNNDWPERLLGGLMRLYDDLAWRPGAAKAVIALTDASFHNPDGSFDENDVIRRSLEIDPVNIFPVISTSSGASVGSFQNLASSTGGEVFVNTGDPAGAVIGAVDKVVNRLILSFPFEEYLALPGDEISFAVSDYGLKDIERYEWDFNGDSDIDLTTIEPKATYTYSNDFSGVVGVRAYSVDGNSGTAVAGVQIIEAGFSALLPSETISATYEPINEEKREFEITWSAPEPDPNQGLRVVVSSQGSRWLIDPSQSALSVSDVPFSGETFYIMSVNKYGTSTPTVVDIPSELDENVFYSTITGATLIGLVLILSRRRQRIRKTVMR